MGLSTLDLVSTLTGWLSSGPSFVLLTLWLVGDVFQLAGVFIVGGLATQKASGFCFAATDIIIMLQLLFYRGKIPFTDRRRRMLELTPRDHRDDDDDGDESDNHGRLDRDGTELHSMGRGAFEVSEKRRSRRRFAPARQGYVELSPAKGRSRAWMRRPTRSSARLGREAPPVSGLARSNGKWKDLNQWRLNVVGLASVSLVMFLVWVGIDLINRDEPRHVLSIAQRPETPAEIVGWRLAWVGTAFYNLPRVYQVGVIIHRRSMTAISVWSYVALVLQNLTMLASIVSVSHTDDTAFAQAPYLSNVAMALVGDFVLIGLYRVYRENPPAPGALTRSWSDPDLACASERHSTTSSGDRTTVGDGAESDTARFGSRRRLSTSIHDNHGRLVSIRRQRTAERQRVETLRKLEAELDRSIRDERAFSTNESLMPFIGRGKLAVQLDRRADALRHQLDQIDQVEGGRAHALSDQDRGFGSELDEKRHELDQLRRDRRQRLERSNRGQGASDREGTRSRDLQDAASGRSPSSASSRREAHDGDPPAYEPRSKQGGQRHSHPRRGVGTNPDDERPRD
ncbi:hypothetical protein JCM10212_006225 [Sporobolomyces blumeae]